MILEYESTKIAKILFDKHSELIIKPDKGEQIKTSLYDKASSVDVDSFRPTVLTSLEQINLLRPHLESKGLCFGNLAVESDELYFPERIFAESVAKHHNGAVSYIEQTCNWMNYLFKYLNRVFVPIDCPSRYSKAGFSSNFSKGFVFYKYSEDPSQEEMFETAVDYIHETGHQLIFLINEVDEIISSDQEELVYSAIKGRERPAILAFHASVTLSYMVLFREFHRRLSGKYVFNSKKMVEKEKQMLSETMTALEVKAEFTEVGKRIFNDIKRVMKLVA